MSREQVPRGARPTQVMTLLNENQKRSVSVTLRLFEERLAEIERLLTVDERGVLYERVGRFSPGQILKMRALIEETRAVIGEMARQFDLEHVPQDPARRIAALLSVTWESLEDLYAKPLRAYGAVDPRLAESIDPFADRLTWLAMALRHVAVQHEEPNAE